MDIFRASLLGLAFAAGGCGIFGDDEEPLEGERIPVRALVGGYVAQPAAPAAGVPEVEAEEN